MLVFSFRALDRLAMLRRVLTLTVGYAVLLSGHMSTQAQAIDCGRLQAQIVQAGRGGGASYAKAVRRQAVELARTQAYGHQLGCDSGGFSFFGGGGSNPQCSGINARISQIQANLGQLQAAGGGDGLVARYNAYCRGGQEPPHERGFFESIFGGGQDERPQAPPPADVPSDDGLDSDGNGARAGSQAVCVRTCDGGFFPMAMSSRHKADSLNEMCTALCPGTEATVFTRRPDSEIKTAMGLDGKSYMDMPNALKFQKAYTPACTCHPPGKSWAESLANAEEILGSQRKGDIMVTQEKSDEMSRPKFQLRTSEAPPTVEHTSGTTKVSPEMAGNLVAAPQTRSNTEEVTGPDGVKRLVRRVGPQP